MANTRLALSVPSPDPHVAKLDNSHGVGYIVDPFALKLSTGQLKQLKRSKVGGAEDGSATTSKSGPEPYGGRHCKTWSEEIALSIEASLPAEAGVLPARVSSPQHDLA